MEFSSDGLWAYIFVYVFFFRYAPGVSWVLVRSGVGSGFKKSPNLG